MLLDKDNKNRIECNLNLSMTHPRYYLHCVLFVIYLQAVVPIHDGVHCVVHGNEVEARAGEGAVGVPAEEQNRDVVIPVEEDQRLFAKNDEQRVDELGNLGW